MKPRPSLFAERRVESNIHWARTYGFQYGGSSPKAGSTSGVDLRALEGLFAFHAIVVTKISADHLIVHDPRYADGSRTIGITAFEAGWTAPTEKL